MKVKPGTKRIYREKGRRKERKRELYTERINGRKEGGRGSGIKNTTGDRGMESEIEWR